MSIITTLVAGILMNPTNVATDIQSHGFKNPEYDWKMQKAVFDNQSKAIKPQKMTSINGTTSYIGGGTTIDDWRTWD